MASSTTKDHLSTKAPVQPGPPSSSYSSSAAQLSEDESRKRNTDCVYFLASPLTCKKGSECEYRHSEYARVNHRDCYFWLNGNCLNPKCSFRHPPLDTLLGPPVDSSAGSTKPSSFGAAPGSLLPPLHTVPSVPHVTAKPTAPCIFFQKGYCLKGDRCPFVHMQNPTSGNKAPEFPSAYVSESSSFCNAPGGLKNSSQLKVAPQANVSSSFELMTSQPKTSVAAVKAVPKNGAFAEKCGMLRVVSNEDLPKHKKTTLNSLNNGNPRNKFGSACQVSSLDDPRFQSGKEADDALIESSPGFDVLVDDELRDADYYGNEDQFPRIQGHEGRNVDDFDIGPPDGYNSVDDLDPVMYRDRHGYDKYESRQERHARDHYRTSSEISTIEGSQYDQRGVYNGVNPDEIGNSDLRHRLSKQRRVNGLSSVVSLDYASDNLAEEQGYRSSSRDSHYTPSSGSSRSSRLQGRIKLPRQSSPVNPPSMHSEREYDKGRNRARSPSRHQLQSRQGRLQDRLRGRMQGDTGRDATSRGDTLDHNSSDFAAPKSLAELKKANQSHSRSQELPERSKESTSVGKRKALESSQHTEDDLSFEGPKPLCEILKRKRKTEATSSHGGMVSGTEEESKSSEPKENAAMEEQDANKSDESGAQNLDLNNVKMTLTQTEISQANNESRSKEDFGTNRDEDHELEDEYYEGDNGGYEEEQYDGEGENGEAADEYMEEDDGDNFAKKIGVMFS